MKTYEDITTVEEVTIATVEEAARITACDLQEEAIEIIQGGDGPVQYAIAGAHNEEAVEILYCPHADRAGVAWGADAAWTDASSARDALERYFGVDGKEMCE